MNLKENVFVFSRLKTLAYLAVLMLSGAVLTAGQTGDGSSASASPTPVALATPVPQANPQDIAQPLADGKAGGQDYTAPQIAESAIIVYGAGYGRINLDQIRKTTHERGSLSLTNGDGKQERAKYERWILRGENLEKEKVRFDKEFPNQRFALVSDGEKLFLIFDNQVLTPAQDAINEFEFRIWHGLDALLRYKENGSTLELVGRDKIMAVDFYVIDVIDPKKRKTRFYISVKSLKIMMLEYEENSVKYRRKFYNYNYAQGTLVPYRTVLWADDKIIEEMSIQTITFGQKVEEYLFESR